MELSHALAIWYVPLQSPSSWRETSQDLCNTDCKKSRIYVESVSGTNNKTWLSSRCSIADLLTLFTTKIIFSCGKIVSPRLVCCNWACMLAWHAYCKSLQALACKVKEEQLSIVPWITASSTLAGKWHLVIALNQAELSPRNWRWQNEKKKKKTLGTKALPLLSWKFFFYLVSVFCPCHCNWLLKRSLHVGKPVHSVPSTLLSR